MSLLSLLTQKDPDPAPIGIATDLDGLLKHVQAERETLQAVVASAATCTTDLPQVRTELDEVQRRAAALTQELDSLATRVASFDAARRDLDTLATRVAALEGGVERAEAQVQQTLAREKEIDERRAALQQLVSVATDTLPQLDALSRERATLLQLEERLPRLRAEFQPLLDQQGAAKVELDQLRTGITSLTRDAETSQAAALKARAHATEATEAVAELQHKLEPLAQLQALSQDTMAQLRTLNSLAEHVAAKVKALESQQQIVDRALVESRRVNEMVWTMEAQITKLNEGSALATRTQETLAQLERVHAQTSTELADAASARDEWTRTVAQHEHDARAALEDLRRHMDRLAVDRRELETLSERQRVLQAGIAEAESRQQALAASEPGLVQVGERAEGLATRVQALTALVERLQHEQAALSPLEERLEKLDALAARTQRDVGSVAQSRQDLDRLREEMQTFQSHYTQTATLLEQLQTDKRAIEQCLAAAGNVLGQGSQLTAQIDALTVQITRAEASADRTLGMAPAVDALADKLATVAPRVQVVDDLEARLNALTTLSTDVDRRLSDQLARRADLERVQVLGEGVAAQLTDAQQKLTALTTAQGQLAPAMAQIASLQADLQQARATLGALQRDEATLTAQEHRLADLAEASRTLSLEVAQRLDTVRGLQTDLSQAGTVKAELLGELAQIQRTQRDTLAQLDGADAQVTRLDTLGKQLAQRRAQWAEAEHAMARVEGRQVELQRLLDDVDRRIQGVTERAQVVEAVKHEVEAIHTLGARCQADLAALTERRADIVQATGEMDRLHQRLVSTSEQIAGIERRRPLVEEVHRQANRIGHVLEDVRITLQILGEQKGHLDHVVAELAQLDAVVHDARGTIRALQAERDVAERIVENVRHLHARAVRDPQPSA